MEVGGGSERGRRGEGGEDSLGRTIMMVPIGARFGAGRR